MRTLALTMATLLVGHAGAKSLTVAMAQIKKEAGFDPTKRITIHEHPTMNGLELALVSKWCAAALE